MKKKQRSLIFIIAMVIIIVLVITIYFMKNNNSTTSTGDNFTCPTTGYINCMPQAVKTAKEKAAAERQARYCDFVSKNCPNVIIAE